VGESVVSEPNAEQRGGRRRLFVVVGVAAALVAAGIVVWSTRPAETSDDARPSRPKPTLHPVRLGDQPIWTTAALNQRSSADWVRTGSDALLASHGGAVTLVDMVTGTARWTLESRADLTGTGNRVSNDARTSVTPSLVGAGADLGVLTGWDYYADCPAGQEMCDNSTGDQQGLALLSGVDGHVVWRTTVIDSYTTTDPERPALAIPVVTDDVAVVAVVANKFDPYAAPPVRTLAIDVRTGATQWETTGGMWPSMAAGHTLLGRQREIPDPTPDDEMSAGTVVAADLRSGKEIWRGARGLDRTELMLAADDAVLVRGVTDAAPDVLRHHVLAVDSGRTVAEFTDLPSGTGRSELTCADDDSTLIACSYRDDRHRDLVAVYRTADRTLTVFPMDFPAYVEHVFAGRIELSGAQRGTVTMDAVGNLIDKGLRLPDGLVDLTDERAVFLTDDHGDPVVEVYPVVSG
jgi:hypothetical protein